MQFNIIKFKLKYKYSYFLSTRIVGTRDKNNLDNCGYGCKQSVNVIVSVAQR